MKPLQIFLCDLTHDTIVLVSDTMPINVGFIGAYMKKLFGSDVEIRLFKYPGDLIQALKDNSPDILALSNYSWNSNLSERMAALAKEICPGVVTVQGGSNFPGYSKQQREFLLKRPATDVFVELEGEVSFSNLVARVLAARDGGIRVYDAPIDGCQFIAPDTRWEREPVLVKGGLPDRIKVLDDIPSPYLNGMLDQFFDGRLRPFLETNRGCPFKCTFCHTGSEYFQKINMFSIERVRAEIDYIAPRIAALGIAGLHIADTNFGMFPRDREICEALKETHDTQGWPKQVIATTGKNNKERVMDITGIMGTIFSVNMSVQSMDKTVLANIKRSNIKLDDYIAVSDHLRRQGRPGFGELILGMPGETKESFITGLKQLIEAGVSAVTVYTLMLLYGTEFQNPDYRKKFEMLGKFRIVPLNFGEYEGVRVFDYEEVGIETKDMPFATYQHLRGISLMVETLHNGRPFEELFSYALNYGEKRSDLLIRIYDSLSKAPAQLQEIVSGFMAETKSELWDSDEKLVEFYRLDENYERLSRGEAGGNLLQKYKSMSLAFANRDWIDFISEVILDVVREKSSDPEVISKAEAQIAALREFCLRKLDGLLDHTGNTEPTDFESPYDIIGWLASPEETPLENFECATSLHYKFYYTPDQLKVRDEYFRRYGTDVNGLSKIVTRISSLESVVRRVKTPDGEQIIYTDVERDRSSRYAMAT
jgi:radical SAM superfamily enzyme YgiQ (UPF0313 family)